MGLHLGLLLAGIGLFVFGIQLLEKALRSLMNRRFKLFLRRQTSNPLKAVVGGTVLSASLQSSSVVNFLVLAFAGSGVITLRNALAVIMGTNLGTTINSWIVATLGFRIDIEAFALPVAGLAGLTLFLFSQNKRIYTVAQFLMGFSLLFIGLDFLKQSVEGEAIRDIMVSLQDSSALVFLLIGFVATTITQSSAATVAITLSLLHQDLVPFTAAMAIVVGSEVGTSVKLVIGALDGVPVKQKISAGNFIYNLITTILAFSLLQPTAVLIQDILHVRDPLIGLAVFQSGMNLASMLLFLPFLGPFTDLLEKWFNKQPRMATLMLHPQTPVQADAAIEILQKETAYFIHQCVAFNARNFHVPAQTLEPAPAFDMINVQRGIDAHSVTERYALLKEQYGEIQTYYMRAAHAVADSESVLELERLIASVRSAMYGAKCVKDLFEDMHEMRSSADDHLYNFLHHMQQDMANFYAQLHMEEWQIAEKENVADLLMHLLNSVQHQYQENMQKIYADAAKHTISDIELATMLNFNRELFTSSKSVIMSMKNFILPVALADKFNDIPTYMP